LVTEFRILRQKVGRAICAEVDDDERTGDVVAATWLVYDALDEAIALALAALSVQFEELREEFLATTVDPGSGPELWLWLRRSTVLWRCSWRTTSRGCWADTGVAN
jgi:hypothetical protein